MYAELQPHPDRYLSTERTTCSVYFNYTRFFVRTVRKCQLKSRCFNSINRQLRPFQWKVSLEKLQRSLKISIKMNSGFYHVLRISIFALLKSLTNPLFRSLSGYARRFCPWRRAVVPLTARNNDFSCLETEPPFYVVTRATRRSNRLQGKCQYLHFSVILSPCL